VSIKIEKSAIHDLTERVGTLERIVAAGSRSESSGGAAVGQGGRPIGPAPLATSPRRSRRDLLKLSGAAILGATAGAAGGAFTAVPVLAFANGAIVNYNQFRVLDTRSGLGGLTGPLHTGNAYTFYTIGSNAVSGYFGVATCVQVTGSGYIEIYSATYSSPPGVSLTQWSAATYNPCCAFVSAVESSVSYAQRLYVGGSGTVHVIVDLYAAFAA
jgi:hypothetical protein